MASVNKVILVGNLGRDPETRYTTGGDAVTNIRVATTDTWKDKNGEKQEKTEWHNCVAWNAKQGGGLADVVERYCKKGKQIYVDGEIEYRQYQDKEGQTRYITEIRVRELILLGGGRGDSDSDGPPPSSSRSSRAPAAGAKPSAKSGGEDFEDFPGALQEGDDDLPF